MEGGSACRAGCWGCCRFLSCLVPAGCHPSCLRSSTPLDDHANESASRLQNSETALPQSDAITPPIEDEVSTSLDRAVQQPAFPLLAADEPHERGEITVALLDTMIPLIENEIDRLDPAKSCSSSSQALGNMLAQWEANKQTYTSIMNSLPKDLQDHVAGNGKALLMPLLTRALGSMGAVHWLGIGFAFISWSLDSISSMSQNREDCIDILRRSLRLLKFTKQTWETANSRMNGSATVEECLRDSVERACRCVVSCASGLQEAWILRFLKANTVEDAVTMLRRELDEAYSQNQTLVGTLILQNTPLIKQQVTFASIRDDIVGGPAKGVIDDALAFLRDSSDVIKVALLHGMGGIGKSTLALQIFTEFQKCRTHRACRVELPLDTRDEHLCAMQREILEKVCKCKVDFSNLTDGKQHMQKQLSQIKDPIFLYVDNVMEQQHLRDSLPKATCFPKASRILITSRNKYGTLDLGNKSRDFSYETFRVRKLEPEQARQLLWKQLESSKEHRDMSGVDIASEEEEVLSLCDGLPLALVVVGKYILHENGLENVGIWREAAKCMRNAEPLDGVEHDELYSRIQFSIQKLHENVKAAFLDLVFFLDIRRYAWEDVERLVGCKYLNILHQRALVQKVQESNGWPDIHDVLKALGRRMITEHKQELHIVGMDQLRALQQTDNDFLKCVVALHTKEGELLDVNLLCQMQRLRLLSHVIVTGESEKAVELRELRVVKDLESHGNIDWSKCSSLKELCWRDCQNLKVFKLDNLPMGLEALQLRSWKALKDVEVLETLTCLKQLQLWNCLAIESLPDGIARLTGLNQLNLSGCESLQSLPDGLASLTSLTKLDLGQCKSLQSLPDGLASLTGLTQLGLSGCDSLQSLPDGLASLTSLTKLDLGLCKSLQSLPDGLASLTGLTQLGLSGCDSLQSLPNGLASLTGLTELNLRWCVSLQSLPEGLASLTGLTKIDLRLCESLQSLPDGLASLTGLTELGLMGCKSLQSLPNGLASLTGLTELNLWWCVSLQSLPDGLASLTGLTKLDLRLCESLQSLPDGLASLTGLRKLGLMGCKSLQSLPDELVSLMTGLTELNLSSCVSLRSLPDRLASLTGLTKLDLCGCESLQSLPDGLASLTSLTQLGLSECKSLQSLPDGLVNLTGLTQLGLRWCESLQSLPDGLASLTSLTELGLSGCKSLQSLPDGLASLTRLTELNLSLCKSLQSLPDGLVSLTGLTELNLRWCVSLQSLPDGLASLTGLTKLDLRECKSLQSLPDGLASLTGLTELGLSGCESLQSLPDGLVSLTGLTELNLRWCVSLQSLPDGLASLMGLTKLDLRGCASLQSLPNGLGSLTGLIELDFDKCVNLQTLPNILVSFTG